MFGVQPCTDWLWVSNADDSVIRHAQIWSNSGTPPRAFLTIAIKIKAGGVRIAASVIASRKRGWYVTRFYMLQRVLGIKTRGIIRHDVAHS